jgi:uncharacterized protein (TIGR03437 family)
MRFQIAVLFLLPTVFGQSYMVSTFAGGGLPVSASPTSASLGGAPEAVAVDGRGNVFIAARNMVQRLDAATNALSVIAGNGLAGGGGDNGPAASAQLNRPSGLAFDSSGNLYVADLGNFRVRKISGAIITTVAGNGTQGSGPDGLPAVESQLSGPHGIAVDAAGTLYIADTNSCRVRKVVNGVMATAAGFGSCGYFGDNALAVNALLNFPSGVAVDSAGILYIADTVSHRIRRVANGVITTVAGTGINGFSGENAAATTAQLNQPGGVAVDSAGNLYIADTGNNRIRKVAGGLITTIAGGAVPLGDNGPATTAGLAQPSGVAIDLAGNIIIADSSNLRIRKITNGAIATIAGNGLTSYSGDGGPSLSAQIEPVGIALDSAGSFYLADARNGRVRKVTKGVITTIAGGSTQTYSGDGGPAVTARLSYPSSVAVDSSGNIYIADTLNNRVRKISGGVITTVAGNGQQGYAGDNGPAAAATLNIPNGVAVDAAGNLYIADSGNYRVRKISNGIITTVAGNGKQGFSGDGGPAANAQLGGAIQVAIDTEGILYIADQQNYRVRKVAGELISTIAGSSYGYSGDGGPAIFANLSPISVAVDFAGNLYITDYGNRLIRKISKSAISSIAGNREDGSNGENVLATMAQVTPWGIAVDLSGNVYFGDEQRVRVLTPVPAINPGGIASAANFLAPVAPGSIASAFGNFLNVAPALGSAPLQPSLSGLSLAITGAPAPPLFTVSSGQINFQVPWELADRQNALVSVTLNGQTGPQEPIEIAIFAPGIFRMDPLHSGQGAVVDINYRLVDSANPAVAGQTVVQIFCTGLGPVTNQPATAAPALSDPLSRTTTTPTVTIGGAPAVVFFSGLAPGAVGEYQVNALVPAESIKGSAVPVVISMGGASDSATIAVK